MSANCPPGTFYRYTKGYRRVAGDTCHGGQEYRYEALMYSCPVEEKSEFLLYSNRHQIHRVKLGGEMRDTVLVERFLQNAVALDFDYKENCLFWAGHSLWTLSNASA
ncbi:sortilin-related receptor-like [Liolophura sinensis]|uniref:sortilin-related receptor-like n=1 Tax=Liolophura sinensis TaxID=3198878 RepID=UPI0031589623